MDYVELSIRFSNTPSEVVIGIISQFEEIQSIQESDHEVLAYIQQTSYVEIEDELKRLIAEYHWQVDIRKLPSTNWNEAWEKNFHPIQLGNLCLIRADFHSTDPEVPYEIILNPKNAFGTGHHETTYLMMDAIHEISWKNKSCLDLGTGTGILSIWAYLLGCRDIVAIDHSLEAVQNTQENFARNQVTDVFQILHGTIELTGDQRFDVVLANINRQVLWDQADSIMSSLKPNGHLLLSGILLDDVDSIEQKYGRLRLLKKAHKGEWSLLHYRS